MRFTDGGDVMRAPRVVARLSLETIENRTEKALQICEGSHAMRGASFVSKLLSDHSVSQEIDKRRRLGI